MDDLSQYSKGYRTGYMAGEFMALLGQDLDLEAALRTSLEFALSKLGPCNAVIYLPCDGGEDYNVGAFVNYDLCHSYQSESILDLVTGEIVSRMSEETEVHLVNPENLKSFFGAETYFFEGNQVLTFACRQENECLAVIVFFRDALIPFPEIAISVAALLQDVLGKIMVKIIKIHHRLHMEPLESEENHED